MAYTRINWEDGERLTDGYVEIEDRTYPVIDPTYTGETPISAYNLNKMDKGIADLYFQPGESFKLDAGNNLVYDTAGYITTSKKEIFFNVVTPKSMENITNITVTGAYLRVRQNGNYLVGTSSGPVPVDLYVKKSTNNVISIRYTDSAGMSSAVNNEVVGIALSNATFTFN